MNTPFNTVVLLLAISSVAIAAEPQSSATSPPEGIRIVGTHSIVLDHPQGGPDRGMAGGPLIGNGDLGVMQSGPAENLIFYIGKNDFWCVRTQSVTPVGQVRIATPALEGATFKATVDMQLAEIRGEYAKGDASLVSRSWVDANRNLLCVELVNKGTSALAMTLRTIRGCGRDAVTPAGVKENGMAKNDPGTVADSDATFLYDLDPSHAEGRKVGCVTRIVGNTDGGRFTLEPGKTAVVATVILSDLDVPGKDALAEARSIAAALTPKTIAEYTAAHRQWWRDFWSRSFVEIPDKVIEQHWYSALYIMGSCSRAG
jgi:hypothetical protein